jgi:ribonuclease VapC
MFVDASAIVAIMMAEPDCDSLSARLEQAQAPITSPVSVFDAVLAVCRIRPDTVAQCEQDVRDFLALSGIRIEAIGDAELSTALEAQARYGKGRGHPAQLNLGDCFTYAMARNHRRDLLFTGNDFSRTDLRPA